MKILPLKCVWLLYIYTRCIESIQLNSYPSSEKVFVEISDPRRKILNVSPETEDEVLESDKNGKNVSLWCIFH